MRWISLILAICSFTGLLTAENPDPFAGYRQAVEIQLSAMLDRQHISRREVREAPQVPASPPAQPKQNNEAEIKAFARQYWGGRQMEFAAAFGRLRQLRPAPSLKSWWQLYSSRAERNRWPCRLARRVGCGN